MALIIRPTRWIRVVVATSLGSTPRFPFNFNHLGAARVHQKPNEINHLQRPRPRPILLVFSMAYEPFFTLNINQHKYIF